MGNDRFQAGIWSMAPHLWRAGASRGLALLAAMVLGSVVAGGHAATPLEAGSDPSSVTLAPIRDNTLIEDLGGSFSNGAGEWIFAGRTQLGSTRRGVIAFDVAGSVPVGAVIESVWLTLHMSMSEADSRTVELHRLLADWGEGTSSGRGSGGASTLGDVTWIHRFFPTELWDSPGGDFEPAVSAAVSVGDTGSYTWGPTPQMGADVQGWLDSPSSNFGWLLKGDEAIRSTKRFDSRENSVAADRPVLTVEYSMPAPVAELQFSDAAYRVAEGVGSATITVTRIGAGAGEVTVSYVASDGAASPNEDYSPAAGTITFADGDTAGKTFTVPIDDDHLVEGDETVNLALSNPTGDARLGSQSTAVLIISASDLEVDVNEDGFVDIRDLRVVIASFGTPPFRRPRSDINLDNLVDILDLVLVARNLGRLAPQALQPVEVERAFLNLSFQNATNLVQPGDGRDRFFVTEQAGLIRVFPNEPAAADAPVFLDLTQRVNMGHNEEGLLGLAFDPGFRGSRYFYVYYSAANPRRSVLSRFTAAQNDPSAADPGSELIIMEILQPFGNHNGGQLAFGPDGYLYVSLGDGGGGGDLQSNAQHRGTLLGSVLRIDVTGTSDGRNYRIPPDNPFVDVDGALDEIWAYGFRNPWRFSFDEHTGALWLGDVGQDNWEEIDLIEPGLNYGWNIMEGGHCFPPSQEGCDRTGLEPPVTEYSQMAGDCSVTGGYVYRGRGGPSLLGAYVYGDFCTGRIWGLRHDGNTVTEEALLVDTDRAVPFITSFGQALDGSLYLLSRSGGVYRLVPAQ